MKKSFLPVLLAASTGVFAQNLPPVISNAQFELSGNNLLTLTYDLEDAEADAVTVSFRATERGGLVFDFNTANATGDLGPGIASGPGKQIQWDYTAYATAQPDFRLMLVADDLQPIDIQAIVDQVDSTRLYDDLDFIEGIRHYTANPAHLQATKDFIEFQFQQNNLETYLHEFDYGNYGAANIIGRQIGTADEAQTYILGGHFDTVNDAPGADDNGSAVAGMLEAMRVLSPYSFKKSVKFIGFDLEEPGLLGSFQYVQNGIQPGEGMAGMIDFEMIGYYSEAPNTQMFPAGFEILFSEAYNEVASQEFKGNFITDVGKTGNSQVLMDAYESASATFVPQLRVIPVEAPPAWQDLADDLGRSDHAPFWLAGVPAIMLTDGANFRNPNYHTPNDKIETLNFSFMANVVKGAVATLAQLAEIQHATTWWADTQFFTPTTEVDGCSFQISPNPVQDFLNVAWVDCSFAPQKFTLLDVAGRTVQTTQASGSDARFDVRNVSSGVYFLKMESPAGSRVEKVVVE